MTTTLLVLVGIVAYLAVYLVAGWNLAAKPYVTREMQHNINRFEILADDPRTLERWRREAASEALMLVPFWPIVLAVRALTTKLADTAPRSVAELQRELDARDQRIADLERELGIGRRSGQ